MKTTKEKIEVMQAFEDGKKIEYYRYDSYDNAWFPTENPTWDWLNYDYRVKEEPKYRPYENTEEMINDFCERSGAKRSPMGDPFIYVKIKENECKDIITSYDDKYTTVRVGTAWFRLDRIFEDCTYIDGSPCGKKIEEK